MEPWTTPTADVTRPMAVLEGVAEGAARIDIDASDLPPPPLPRRHDLTRARDRERENRLQPA